MINENREEKEPVINFTNNIFVLQHSEKIHFKETARNFRKI